MRIRKIVLLVLCIVILCTTTGCSLMKVWLQSLQRIGNSETSNTSETDPYPLHNDIAIPKRSKVNSSNTILILGNSFIGTSEIGAFLDDMLARGNTQMTCEAISRGYATVQTYTSDTYLMETIAEGQYCYVFQCGFYRYKDAVALEEMAAACKASNTGLVAFPAHNEQEDVINMIGDVPLLNWKGEINAIIDRGVAYRDFCIDDAHQHSTPLAGYVGAGLIYRAVLRKNPPELSQAPLTMWEVEQTLGSYTRTWNRKHVCK